MKLSIIFAALIPVLAASAMAVTSSDHAKTQSAAERCDRAVADLRGPWGEARFRVELAETEQARAKGLMYRERLPDGTGMLFVFPEPISAAFWMKNTRIPLDMLFFDQAGDLRHIHRNAIPFDETPIPGGSGIKAVLEVNAGAVNRLGIDHFTTMRSPVFNQSLARWPCRSGDLARQSATSSGIASGSVANFSFGKVLPSAGMIMLRVEQTAGRQSGRR